MEELLALIAQVQAISQSGEFYSKNDFDIDRFRRLRDIAGQMVSVVTEQPFETVRGSFLADYGYQTPKVDSRAVIFREDKLLLVQERDGRWALPGGWIDVGLSVRENTVKEAQEEAGLEVRTERLIAVLDKTKDSHHHHHRLFSVYAFLVECSILGGSFQENLETVQSRFFALDEIPELAPGKTTRQHVELCFQAHGDPDWTVVFD